MSPASRWQGLLADISRSDAIDAGNVPAAAQMVCDAATSGLNVVRASVWLVDPSLCSMQCVALVDRLDASAPNNLSLSDQDYPSYFSAVQALEERRCIAVEDCLTDACCRELVEPYLRPLQIGAMLDTPIHRHGQLTAILCAEHRGGPRRWSEDEQVFTANLGDLFARAMIAAERMDYEGRLEQLNASLEQRVQERTERLEQALANLESTQHQLIEREKLAALGSLVAGVAHEINTPVGVAMTAASHGRELLRNLDRGFREGKLQRSTLSSAIDGLDEALDMVMRNIERAARLVESFKRTAADRTSEQRSRFEVNAYAEAVLATLQPLLRRRGVTLQFEAGTPCELDSFPGALAHALSNLVTNAALHAFAPQTPEARLRVSVRCEADQVCIEVVDNGRGMDAALRQRAFDPFFTTARADGGTGLGLAIARSMVEQSLGGSLQLETAPGQGCRFLLRLPRRAPE